MTRPPRLEDTDVLMWCSEHAGWAVRDNHLRRSYEVEFSRGARIIVAAADVANEMDHHPNFSLRYGILDVELWTHDRTGVTSLDLTYASRLDEIVAATS